MPADYRERREETLASLAVNAEPLPLLYQGMLTAIVRIQSGKQQIGEPNAFQRRMEDLLEEIEREAVKIGYRKQEIEDANYAMVAFLDESVYSSSDPSRAQWQSFGAKRYSQAIAGEGLFDRLKIIRTRQDSPALADLMEIYYLCFALGYQGRYAVSGQSEFQTLMFDVREHIDRIRGRRDELSPKGAITPQPSAPSMLDPIIQRLQIGAIAAFALMILSWAIFRLLLGSSGRLLQQ